MDCRWGFFGIRLRFIGQGGFASLLPPRRSGPRSPLRAGEDCRSQGAVARGWPAGPSQAVAPGGDAVRRCRPCGRTLRAARRGGWPAGPSAEVRRPGPPPPARQRRGRRRTRRLGLSAASSSFGRAAASPGKSSLRSELLGPVGQTKSASSSISGRRRVCVSAVPPALPDSRPLRRTNMRRRCNGRTRLSLRASPGETFQPAAPGRSPPGAHLPDLHHPPARFETAPGAFPIIALRYAHIISAFLRLRQPAREYFC